MVTYNKVDVLGPSFIMAMQCADCRHVIVWSLVKIQIHVQYVSRTLAQRFVVCVSCYCN